MRQFVNWITDWLCKISHQAITLFPLLTLSLLMGPWQNLVVAQAPSGSPEAELSPADELSIGQGRLADKYRRLEQLIARRAELEAATNPRRSALLKQALEHSNRRELRLQFESLVNLLNRRKLKQALDTQTEVRDDMMSLLELLLSEDRPERLKNEQTRLRSYIRDLERIIRQQKSAQARTEANEHTKKMATEQKKIADRTTQLGDTIDQNEGITSQTDNNADPSSSKEGSKQPRTPTKEDANNKQGDKLDSSDNGPSLASPADKPAKRVQKQSDSESSQSEKHSQSQTPADGSSQVPPLSPNPSQPGQPEAQQSQQNQSKSFPGRQRIRAAEDMMRQAQQQLDDTKREQAVEKQRKAKLLLQQAKAELEEILRQLREEEIERALAVLETRFRRMLQMQLKVNEDTNKLDEIPVASRDRQTTIRSGKLAFAQRRIGMEAEKTLILLREEGSSVAFPETVEQMRDDIEQVAERLSQTQISQITQAIQADIVNALEEMIQALQKAQQDQEERKQKPGQSQSSQPGEDGLVDSLAELRMIRSLQVRVNRRTQRFSDLLDNKEDPAGQATDVDLIQSLKTLADREARIHHITREILLGKNQ